jgi:16S rRNA (cytidine1402-2'-O)-methyltransferase
MSGTLYLVPTPISAGPLRAVLPQETIEIAHRLTNFLAEDAKTARTFLKSIGHPRPLREVAITEIGHAPRDDAIEGWLAPLATGHDIGVVSEAGCPGIADPGANIVAAAHARGLHVRPLVGPSAILLALMASGLNGQRFRFVGYLPVDALARAAQLKLLERESRARDETQMFIETPYRSKALFDAMLAHCAPSTRLGVAAELTGANECVLMRSVEAWRAARDRPELDRRPTVFSLLAR